MVEQANGLPIGRRQAQFEVDGQTLREDVVYDEIGVPLTVRLDGREYHSDRGVMFRYRRRDNAAELRQHSRLSYGWRDVVNSPCGVAAEVSAVLRRGGWPKAQARCPRCS
ncbi:MAG: hypothetical protein ACRDRN_06220 [Sciscionella sp.]